MDSMPVTVRVPVDQSWRAGDTLQVYCDQGSGTIDFTRPLLNPRFDMFPGTFEERGYGGEPYGAVPYGGGAPTTKRGGGYGDQAYGSVPYGGGTAHVDVRVFVGQGFGSYKFAAETFDRAGNVQSGAPVEFSQLVSGGDPPPLRRFDFGSFASVTDQVTFNVAV